VIGYDLKHKKDESPEELFAAIKKSGAWWHCLDSTWIVDTERSVDDMLFKLDVHIKPDDKLLIAPISGPHTAASPDMGYDWLHTHLKGKRAASTAQ